MNSPSHTSARLSHARATRKLGAGVVHSPLFEELKELRIHCYAEHPIYTEPVGPLLVNRLET